MDTRPVVSRKRLVGIILKVLGLSLIGLLFVRIATTEYLERRDTSCRMNVMNIGLALEMCTGSYPADLADLSPKLLKTVPTCPVSGQGYTYELGPPYKDANGLVTQDHTVYCAGENHPRHWAANYPQYTSKNGLSMAAGPHSHVH